MYKISTDIHSAEYYYNSNLAELSDGVLEVVKQLETRDDVREFVKSMFPGSTISFGLKQARKYTAKAYVYDYVQGLHSINIKLVGGSSDIAWFLYRCFFFLFYDKEYFDGLYVKDRYIKLSITEKVEKKVAVTEETFVDALVKLGFNAKWADSTKNIYKYYMMKAIIVKEGNTFLVYNFNRGHGYIKTLSEKGKPASEVGSITDILGQPQIIFDAF